MYRWYPELTSADYCSVILVEAGKHLLGTFDESLSTYVEKLFARRNVKVLTEQSVARVEGTLATTVQISKFATYFYRVPNRFLC